MLRFSWLLAAVLVVAGCTAWSPSPSQPPVLSADPSLVAQIRLLEEAQAHRAQGQHAAAVRLLERFISTYPGSPHLAEARWWLARSYEQLGEVGAALVHYRTLAAGATGGREESYEMRAMRRLEELRRAGNRPAAAVARTAVMLPPARLPPLADLEPWMGRLVRAGVTTLVLEAVTGDGVTPAGVYFNTSAAPMHRDVFGLVLPMARRVGLAVFAEVPLHRMPWVDPRSDWVSAVYDPGERRLRPSAAVDLLNRAVQDKLVELAADLAQSGIEGVLVRFNDEPGFFAECGQAARNGFAAAFGVEPKPAQLCSIDGRTLEAMPPEFWRWISWKFHERLHLVERIRAAMRQKNPRVVVALEVHPEAVVDPRRALIEYGEDLTSLLQRGFDLVLGMSADSMEATSRESSKASAANALPALARWMSERAVDPRRLWITNVVQFRDARMLGEGLSDPHHRALLPDGVNLLHRAESAVAIP